MYSIKHAIQFALAFALATFPLTALAQNDLVSYDYLGIGFAPGKAQDYDARGFRLEGSRTIGDNLYATASYATLLTSNDLPDPSMPAATAEQREYRELAVGIGWHTSIEDVPDLLLEIQYVQGDADLGEKSQDGYRGAVGFRMPGGERFEVNGKIIHTRLGTVRDTGFGLESRVKFGEDKSFGVGYEQTLNIKAFNIGVRIGI